MCEMKEVSVLLPLFFVNEISWMKSNVRSVELLVENSNFNESALLWNEIVISVVNAIDRLAARNRENGE